MSLRSLAFVGIGVLSLAASLAAEEQPAPTQEQLTFFETKVRPVLVMHCYECHAADSKIVQGGLRLDSRAGLLQGGDTGPAIVPGKGVNPPNYAHRKPRAGEEFLRTIYLPVMRTNTATNDRVRTFFDFVNPAQIAGQRSQTVVPTQALFVMNNELFRQRAKKLADQVIATSPENDARLSQLWLRVFNRPISSTERDEALAFLKQLEATLDTKDPAARESQSWQELCHSLLASNEFLWRI